MPSRQLIVWCIVAGVAVGIAYVLSPLTVLFAAALVPFFRWAVSGLDGEERRWVVALLAAAIAVRVLVVAGLFLATNHHVIPFGSLFGDEEYFIRRSLWLRSVALSTPIMRADFIYAFEEYSATSYLYVLALIHTLFGPSPYGAHLFSILCYLVASLVLYRLVRPAYGRLPAFVGLAILLFLPSLFAWSVAALKEPLYLLVMSVGVAAAVAVTHAPTWPARVLAAVVMAAAAIAAQTIRAGGLAMVGVAAVIGLMVAVSARRPRLLIALALACLVIAPIVATRGRVQDLAVKSVRQVASVHWGHVNTPGYVYTVMDGSFYLRRAAIDEMTFRQGVRYLVGSLAGYVVMPLPWKVESRAALSYLPEQLVWYLIVVLAPIGLVSAFRRDPSTTAILAAYAVLAAVLVAVTSGNIGTLVRHRGLALPYLVWFSALGGCEAVGHFLSRGQDLHVNH
jgi:hypothetical protein